MSTHGACSTPSTLPDLRVRRHPACLDGELVWQPEFDSTTYPPVWLSLPPPAAGRAKREKAWSDAYWLPNMLTIATTTQFVNVITTTNKAWLHLEDEFSSALGRPVEQGKTIDLRRIL